MKNGLYKVQFQTGLGEGFGVVYAENGRLRGGDSGLYYLGTYEESGGSIKVDVSTKRHMPDTGMPISVFGVDQANITLTGSVDGNHVKATGIAKEAPGVMLTASLDFICE